MEEVLVSKELLKEDLTIQKLDSMIILLDEIRNLLIPEELKRSKVEHTQVIDIESNKHDFISARRI